MINPALPTNMLPGPNQHALGRRHIHNRRLSRVCVRDPQGQRVSVGGAAKWHGDGAGELQQEGGRAILVRCDGEADSAPFVSHGGQRGSRLRTVHFGAWLESGILGEGLGDVRVCAVDVVVFLAQIGRELRVMGVRPGVLRL